MKQYKNILAVYNDGTGAENALSQAAEIAKANCARLTLVDVLQPATATPSQRAEREKALQHKVNLLRLDGIDRVAFKLLIGTEYIEVANQVIHGQHDIVIASAETGGDTKNLSHVKPAIQLIRQCPCPVWLLKPGHALQFGRILAAVDPDPRRPETDQLSTKIMDLSTCLAIGSDAELHVIHAWDVTGKDRGTLRSKISDKARDSLLEKHQKTPRQQVEKLLSKYKLDRVPHTIHLPRNLPERAVLETVNKEEIDLIVLGQSSRASLAGLLSSHAAESILSAVRGGLFIVKSTGVGKERVPELQELQAVA